MDCEIRPMTAQELPAVAALERACFSHPWSEQSLSASLHNGRSVFLTAHGAGELLGYLGMEYILGEGSVTNVAVFPPYRRQGVASALTSRLALEILALGKVPFYCAAWSTVRSVRNAIRSGFRPAWVELTARDRDFVNRMNGHAK